MRLRQKLNDDDTDGATSSPMLLLLLLLLLLPSPLSLPAAARSRKLCISARFGRVA
jgi:hypothetical protein